MDIDSGSKSPTHAPASSAGSKDVKYSANQPIAGASTPASGSATSGPSSSTAGSSTGSAAAAVTPVLGSSAARPSQKRSASEALPSGPSAGRFSGIPADRFLGAARGRVTPIPETLTGSITRDRADSIRAQQLRRSQAIFGTPPVPVLSGASAPVQANSSGAPPGTSEPSARASGTTEFVQPQSLSGLPSQA